MFNFIFTLHITKEAFSLHTCKRIDMVNVVVHLVSIQLLIKISSIVMH